jgi:methylthioribose-1-phosphate isomerase
VLTELEAIAEAIETLAVRGAPAIGGCAALALALFAQRAEGRSGPEVRQLLDDAQARLRATRPTAVNLFYALDKVMAAAGAAPDDADAIRAAVVDAAEEVCTEDAAACDAMARHGAELFEDGDRIMTVCHTGALATCGTGTALGVLKAAAVAGKKIEVFALETRPLLQGARLTAWECMKVGLDVTLITDGMAAFAMARKGITKAIAGADRIAANGDVANKIGTYGLATLCRAHGEIPFYVAAPSSTFDVTLTSGAEIPIEERNPDEIRTPRGAVFAPEGCPVWNPAFDVTPSALVAGIITERGIWERPFDATARDQLLART